MFLWQVIIVEEDNLVSDSFLSVIASPGRSNSLIVKFSQLLGAPGFLTRYSKAVSAFNLIIFKSLFVRVSSYLLSNCVVRKTHAIINKKNASAKSTITACPLDVFKH